MVEVVPLPKFQRYPVIVPLEIVLLLVNVKLPPTHLVVKLEVMFAVGTIF
jgi:hypothetical protein